MSAINIMDLPAMKPPPGMQPNFDNPPNKNAMTVAVISVCLSLSSIAVILRIFSRWSILRKMELQDCLLLAAFGIYVAICVVSYGLAENPGWFIHMWNLHTRDMIEFLRTAILVEWLRIFLPNGGGRQTLFFWLCHFVIWANIIYCIVTLILFNLSCVPYEYLWNRTLKGGYCRINTVYIGLSASCWAFATDIIILFIPQRIIWNLNMTRRHKLVVSVIFALGLCACAASIVRLYHSVKRTQSADQTYGLSTVQLTAVGEMACAILVLCVPSLPKAVSELKQTRLPSSITLWSSLVSVLRHRLSQKSRKKGAASLAESSWPSPIPAGKSGGRSVNLQVEAGSERHLIRLKRLQSLERYDPELGNAIIRNTRFEVTEGFESGHDVATQEHKRQHPWMYE